MDPIRQPDGSPRWQYTISWRYGHLLLVVVGLALIGFGASGLPTTTVAVTMLPLGMILLVIGVALPRLKGPFTAGPTGIGADMLRLDELDPLRVTFSVPGVSLAAVSTPAAIGDAGAAVDSIQVERSNEVPDSPPITIGDVWDALAASGFREVYGSAGTGRITAEGPDGQFINLPIRRGWDYRVASDDLLAVLAALDIRPVASGKRPGKG